MRGGDRSHRSRSPYIGPTGPQDMVAAWEYTTNGVVGVSPVLDAAGTVYGASDDGSLFALHGDTGAAVWTVSGPQYVFASPALSSSALGLVYYGLDDGRVVALKTTDGSMVWEHKTDGPVYSSPVIAVDGTVYVGSNDRHVYALDGGSGVQRWATAVDSEVWTAPALSDDDALVFVTTTFNGGAVALRTATGAVAWSFPVGHTIFSSPLVTQERVYFGADDGHLYALHCGNGSLAWKFQTAESPIDWPLRASPSLSRDGDVMVMAWSGHIYALQPVTGAELWKLYTYEPSTGCLLADGNDVLFTGGMNAMVMRFEERVFKGGYRPLQSPIMSCPALAPNGWLYIGASYRMYAVKTGPEPGK